MLAEGWWPILNILARANALLAQERMYEWHWEMHPMWWGWGIGMMAMMLLFWPMCCWPTVAWSGQALLRHSCLSMPQASSCERDFHGDGGLASVNAFGMDRQECLSY